MTQATRPNRVNFSNLVDVLHDSADLYRDRPLFGVLGDGDVSWRTFGEFRDLVDRFRAGLASLGVGRGEKVAVISNNRLEWAVGAYACFSLGAAYVPMYEAQQDKEWHYILADSGARVCLVANRSIEDRVEAMRDSLPMLRHVVSFEREASDPRSYASLLETGDEVPPVIPEADQTAMLVYTSGTTGTPKGVVLTHGNLSSNINGFLQVVEVGTEDRGLSFLPWAHVFGGCVEMNLAIATGSSTAILSDPNKLTEYLPVVQPTVLFAVPRVWNKVHAGIMNKMGQAPKPVRQFFHTALEAKKKQNRGENIGLTERGAVALAEKTLFPKVRQGLGGRLRFAVSGAAALSRDVGEFMFALGIEVHEGYGLTETGGGATAQPADNPRLGSVGKAVPGIELKLDKSVPAADDEAGELIIYGGNVTPGYHNREDETRESLTPDGGFRTGDLARIDEEGFVYITGRAKELYKLENGKYVAPVPIEERLERSPYIGQAIVTGQNKPHNVAVIVPDKEALRQWAQERGLPQDEDTLLRHSEVRSLFEGEVERANAEGKGYERIADFVLEPEEFTPHNGLLTPTLKPKRPAIMERYSTDLETLYKQAAGEHSQQPAPRASYIRELRDMAKSA